MLLLEAMMVILVWGAAGDHADVFNATENHADAHVLSCF